MKERRRKIREVGWSDRLCDWRKRVGRLTFLCGGPLGSVFLSLLGM